MAASLAKFDNKNNVFKLNILLVEDETLPRMLISSILSKINSRENPISIAVNGEEAIAKFKEQKFDLILMDKNMPKLDGLTATAEIRKFEKDSGLERTLIISTSSEIGIDDAAKKAGIDILLPKPFTMDALLAILNEKFIPKPSKIHEGIFPNPSALLGDKKPDDLDATTDLDKTLTLSFGQQS